MRLQRMDVIGSLSIHHHVLLSSKDATELQLVSMLPLKPCESTAEPKPTILARKSSSDVQLS
jgi:hypothetical protein